MGLVLSYIKVGVPMYDFRRLIINTKYIYNDEPTNFNYLSNDSLTEIVLFLDYALDRDFRQRSLNETAVCSCGVDGSKDVAGWEQIAVVESHIDVSNFCTKSFVLHLTRVKCWFCF
jgi:hypothetical protein